jgi:type I restriction enzyme R subunit
LSSASSVRWAFPLVWARLDDLHVGRESTVRVRQRASCAVEQIIADEGLSPEETRAFVERAFRDGAIPTTGAAVTEILPPTSRFAADDSYGIKKPTVLDRLAAFFERYFALG